MQIPVTVPIHWQVEAKHMLYRDCDLDVLEEAPYGEPAEWCCRMVLTEKADDTLRRTVDYSPLNRHCLRETHHVKPPFQQAKSIPPNT